MYIIYTYWPATCFRVPKIGIDLSNNQNRGRTIKLWVNNSGANLGSLILGSLEISGGMECPAN